MTLMSGLLKNGKNWGKLFACSLRKLEKVLENPHIENNRLHGELNGCYKIKLRSSGYRLVYKVEDETVVVFVLAVGKRERNQAYDNASERLTKLQISSDANQ